MIVKNFEAQEKTPLTLWMRRPYIYGHEKFVRFPREAKKLNEF